MTYTTDYYHHHDDEYNYYRFKYEIGNAKKLETAINNLSICIDELKEGDTKDELKYYFYELVNEIQSLEFKPDPESKTNQADEDDDNIPF